MRILLTLWFLPLVIFWGWYALSYNDISFGFNILTRDVHDLVFQIYANILGVEKSALPGMIAGACAFDTALVMAIAAFRWRKSWWPQTYKKTREIFNAFWNDDLEEEYRFKDSQSGPAHPAE